MVAWILGLGTFPLPGLPHGSSRVLFPALGPGLLGLWFLPGPAAGRSAAAFGLQALRRSLAADWKDRAGGVRLSG